MSTNDLLTRRAIFVYKAARLAAVAACAPIIPEEWWERDDAFREQFILAIDRLCSMPELPTAEVLHNQWMAAYFDMGWTYGEQRNVMLKTHPDLVPFAQLAQREQDKDSVFAMLVTIARDWIRE